LYIDGTKKNIHSIEAIYSKLPFIPQIVVSLLINIFFVMAFKKKDKFNHGFETFLSILAINEAIELENNGITLMIDGKKTKHQVFILFDLGR
jgi:hypothetical protein